jgi:hypothetical protein
MVKNPVVSAREEELTAAAVSIEIYALGTPVTIRHDVTQARVVIGKILTWTCALFSDATFHFGIIHASFGVDVEE